MDIVTERDNPYDREGVEFGVVFLTKALMTYDSNLREEHDTYSGWYAYFVTFYNPPLSPFLLVEMHRARCQISKIESEENF